MAFGLPVAQESSTGCQCWGWASRLAGAVIRLALQSVTSAELAVLAGVRD